MYDDKIDDGVGEAVEETPDAGADVGMAMDDEKAIAVGVAETGMDVGMETDDEEAMADDDELA